MCSLLKYNYKLTSRNAFLNFDLSDVLDERHSCLYAHLFLYKNFHSIKVSTMK